MWFAQQTPTTVAQVLEVTVDGGTDWWQVGIGLGTLVAALVAVLTSLATARQQQSISHRLATIEEREHAWLATDRRPWIEVTRNNTAQPTGHVLRELRLRNIGKSAAYEVRWQFISSDEGRIFVEDHVPRTFDIIEPGEHVTLYLIAGSIGDEDHYPLFEVTWIDDPNHVSEDGEPIAEHERSNLRNIND